MGHGRSLETDRRLDRVSRDPAVRQVDFFHLEDEGALERDDDLPPAVPVDSRW